MSAMCQPHYGTQYSDVYNSTSSVRGGQEMFQQGSFSETYPHPTYMISVVTLAAFQSHGHVDSLTLKFFLLELGET